ncbi:peptidoglycan recognition protein-like [Macrosteles quadrilineatus]|uniref:peptidoglycan recognition protein-like n=1 Tax=Macrosteles quadrilineatus TaxID=74068 RepID=UPI0023E1190F|nr:peptidoglycan recognition protein-like [Macrosteles quadrilineatus]
MYYVQHSQRIDRPGFRIISRDEWGAVDPLWVKFLALPVQHVFFEYTNTDECTNREECMEMIRIIQRYNLKLRSNPDIRYNFLIASDGTVYEGRGWDSAPRLPQKYSNVRRKALYVALIGNYIDKAPSEKMFQARSDLVEHGVSLKYVSAKHLEYSIVTPKVPGTLDN